MNATDPSPERIAELRRRLRRIELRARRLVSETLGGEYHSVFKGRGMEFSDVREYRLGDDVRTLDWNVTARSGVPHVKKFVEERELTLMVVVDVSASMLFGTRGQSKRDLAAELGATFAFSAVRNDDRVGLALVTDVVERYLRPDKGRQHVLRVVREVLGFVPRGRRTDLAATLTSVRRLLTKRSVVVLVSDFVTADADFARALRQANLEHDVVGVLVEDRRDRELPRLGLVDFAALEDDAGLCRDTSSRQLGRAYAAAARGRRETLARTFARARADLLGVETGTPYEAELLRFFHERERRRAEHF